jgi:hypothetical protein
MEKQNKDFNLKLTELGYLSRFLLLFLHKNGIDTIGEFVNLKDDEHKYNRIVNSLNMLQKESTTPDEFYGTQKILRYVYLKEDPQFEDHDNLKDFGFSGKAYYALNANKGLLEGTTTRELIGELSDPKMKAYIYGFRNCGAQVAKEIILKSNIINDYFKSKYDIPSESISDDELFLQNMLESLLQQEASLDSQIKMVRESIERVRNKISYEQGKRR